MNPKILFATCSLVLVSTPGVFAAKGGGGGGGPAGGGAGASPEMGNSHAAEARPTVPDRPGNAAAVVKPNPTDHPARSAAPAAQDFSETMKSINQTAFAQRKELLDSVDMRLQSSRDSLKQIQAAAKASRADARDDFKKALAEVKTRETELNAAVKASRNADEAAWAARRTELARANQNLTDALGRLDAARHLP